MLRHPIKKVFGLTLFYGILIIGIFVLQFKNESVISRNIGLLRIAVAQSQDPQGNIQLKNTMQASYKGISFTADASTPALLKLAGNPEPKPLVLTAWEQDTPQSYTFHFDGNASLTFAVTGTPQTSGFSILAKLPPEAESLSLSYKIGSGFSIAEQSKNRQLISSKHDNFLINAPEITPNAFVFTNTGKLATYAAYEPQTRFTFHSVPEDVPLAQKAAYEETVKRLKNEIMAIPDAVMQDSSLFTESTAVAYVAEMAKHGLYRNAVAKLQDASSLNSRRTYVSAPYLGSLVSMNQSLSMVNGNMQEMTHNALAQKNLDIFNVASIADYMLREYNAKDVQSLANLVSTLTEFTPTLSQATGIIHVYLDLEAAHSPLAKKFTGALHACLTAIENHCTFANDMLYLTEKGMKVSLLQAVDTGKALLSYGIFTNTPEHAVCGRLIVNSAFSTANEHDYRTLADLYPILVTDNTFYPHFAILGETSNHAVWAWTCAQDISYQESADRTTATITVTFPENESHYLIINGVRPFFNIDIYGISFHTDARFETYNSSGYVYNEQTQTLFLKSRHKTKNEVIKMYYTRPVQKPEPEVQPQQTGTTEPAGTPEPQNSQASVAPAETQQSE